MSQAIYDPTAEFEDDDQRPRSAAMWQIRGEAFPQEWREFADRLEARHFYADTPGYTVDYTAPEGSIKRWHDVAPHPDLEPWGDLDNYWQGKAKPRGRYLFVKLAVRPQVSIDLQGRAGSLSFGTPPDEYMNPDSGGQPKLEKVELFADALEEDGLVPPHGGFKEPGRLPPPVIELDTDGHLTSWQEGRHRSLAAQEADLDWMPMWVFREAPIGHDRSEVTTYYPHA